MRSENDEFAGSRTTPLVGRLPVLKPRASAPHALPFDNGHGLCGQSLGFGRHVRREDGLPPVRPESVSPPHDVLFAGSGAPDCQSSTTTPIPA